MFFIWNSKFSLFRTTEIMTNNNLRDYWENQQEIKVELDQDEIELNQEQLKQLHAMIAKRLFSWAQQRKSGKKLRNLSF